MALSRDVTRCSARRAAACARAGRKGGRGALGCKMWGVEKHGDVWRNVVWCGWVWAVVFGGEVRLGKREEGPPPNHRQNNYTRTLSSSHRVSDPAIAYGSFLGGTTRASP
eukprot:364395-Chlamydomonas_euryale.AAC.4